MATLLSFSSPGRLRPKPKSSVWYYRYIGRYRSLSSRGLGQYVGRMKGKKKVYECARRANKMGYRAFALRNGGDCYVSRYKRRYASKRRVFGRSRASSGGPRVIDAYVVGKGKFDRNLCEFRPDIYLLYQFFHGNIKLLMIQSSYFRPLQASPQATQGRLHLALPLVGTPPIT